MLSVVTWINPNGGAWEVASNWSKDGVSALPGPGDDVIINVNAGAVITHTSDPTSIRSLQDDAPINFSGGSLTLAGSSEIDNTLNFSGGTINGSGNLTVTGSLNWTGGTMSGTGTTDANGGINFGGSSIKILDTRTLDNNAGGTWMGTGNISLADVATFNNYGTLDALGSATFASSTGGGVFNNAGLFRNSAGTGTATVAVPFNNSGAVDLESGTLAVTGGGNSGGTFIVAQPATLAFSSFSGAYRLAASSSVVGSGNVSFTNGTTNIGGVYDVGGTIISSGTANFLGDATTGGMDFSGGAITGPSTVTITGPLNWTGGTMSGTGTTDAEGGLIIIGSFNTLDTRTLNNDGDGTWAGTGTISFSNGATFNNNGTLDALGNATFATSTGGGVFNNAGTFQKLAGLGTTTVQVPFNNSGEVDVEFGTLSLSGGGSSGGAFTVAAPATLTFTGVPQLGNTSSVAGDGNVAFSAPSFGVNTTVDISGSYTIAGTTTVSSRATVDFLNDATTGLLSNSGTVTIAAGTRLAVAGDYTQASGGVTVLNDGTLDAGGDVVIASGSSFSGLGSIGATLVANSGQLSLGTATTAGLLTITGDYAQAATGVLNIKLGGLVAGDQFDELNVSGNATLDGTLNVTLFGGYSPAVGDSFVILTFGAVSGDFATKNGLNLAGGRRLDPKYSDTSLVLVTVPTPGGDLSTDSGAQ